MLRDLQSQLAGQETAQVPGQSLARPLHVMLQVQPSLHALLCQSCSCTLFTDPT